MWCYVSAHWRSTYWWISSMSSMLILDYRYWSSPMLCVCIYKLASATVVYLMWTHLLACSHRCILQLKQTNSFGPGKVQFLLLLGSSCMQWVPEKEKKNSPWYFANSDWCACTWTSHAHNHHTVSDLGLNVIYTVCIFLERFNFCRFCYWRI